MKTLLYLSGAPRVSTRDDAEASGARAHILGTIDGFENNGFKVEEYIVGNLNSPKLSGGGTEKQMAKSLLIRIAADLVRISSSVIHKAKSYKKYKNKPTAVYERFGAFQNLGSAFHKHGVKWILETNSPLFYEASKERKSIFFTELCKKLELKAYHECDYLVCVTTELKNIISKEAGIPESKIIVLPNGVDTKRFNPETVTPIKVAKKFHIGFVGILAPWCGVEVLIQAIHVLKQQGVELSAVIVGDGIMIDTFKELTASLGLNDEVNFVGRVNWSAIPSYIAGFDLAYSGQINLQMGKMYHSPLKIYEYMAMGKPVIASAFEDAKNMVQNEVNGYLFEPGNVDSLVGVLKQAIANFEVLDANKGSIRNNILVNHSWKQRMGLLIERCQLSDNSNSAE